MRNLTLKTIDLFYLFCSIALLLYSIYRSYTLSFTHDESYSFLHIIHGTVYQIISNGDNCWISANNHILNSLCMRYSEFFFGPNEFNLRAHSVIAHAIYITYTYLILKEIKSTKLQLIGFIVLNFNPYLLDFFSLARGYALSIAFMTMSVYYFTQFIKKETFFNLTMCLFSGIIATLANFSIITFTASVIILFECFMIFKRYSLKQFLTKNIPISIALCCLYCIYRWPITELITHGQLFFGGDKGLWEDTVVSSIEVYLYGSKSATVLSLFFKCLVIVTLIANIFMFYYKIKHKNINPLDFVFLIIAFILGINFVQHFFMDTSYFKERLPCF